MMMLLFNSVRNFARRFAKDERGQAMVEYGLIIALVAVVLIVVLVALSGGLGRIFGGTEDALTNAANSAGIPGGGE
jgi:pilus assembly protein Flp/PilA